MSNSNTLVKTTENGDQIWDRSHADGATIVRLDGTLEYYKDGKFVEGDHNLLDRHDGPAVIRPDGTKIYFKDGYHHREDSPAIEAADGEKMWYINGVMTKWVNKNGEEIAPPSFVPDIEILGLIHDTDKENYLNYKESIREIYNRLEDKRVESLLSDRFIRSMKENDIEFLEIKLDSSKTSNIDFGGIPKSQEQLDLEKLEKQSKNPQENKPSYNPPTFVRKKIDQLRKMFLQDNKENKNKPK